MFDDFLSWQHIMLAVLVLTLMNTCVCSVLIAGWINNRRGIKKLRQRQKKNKNLVNLMPSCTGAAPTKVLCAPKGHDSSPWQH